MIIITLLASALTLYLGYQWGLQRGKTEIERTIVDHVMQSPQYLNEIAIAIRKSLEEIKS
jgi:hypothetical protein